MAQSVPAEDENIEYLVTFSASSDKSWGDDDFTQIFFFNIPKSPTTPFYLRVFDPDTGGEADEQKGDFNTIVRFSVYGGKGAWSDKDAKGTDPTGNFESGNLIDSKSFDNNPRYDQEWYSFGPFNPLEGEYAEELGGICFQDNCEGYQW